MFSRLRSYFFAGLLVVLPFSVTIWLFLFLTRLFDSWVLPILPEMLHPSVFTTKLQSIFGVENAGAVSVSIPGIGVIIFIVATIIIGWLTMGFIGRTIMGVLEKRVVNNMPIVRTVYGGMKQIVSAIITQKESSFEKACLVEYPRKGLWVIGFITSDAMGKVATSIPGDKIIGLFIPTTPNPTSGFLIFVPRKDIVILDMNIEEAVKLVISAGLVYPDEYYSDKNTSKLPSSDIDGDDIANTVSQEK